MRVAAIVKALIVIDSLGTGGAEHSLADLLVHLPTFGIAPVVAVLQHCREGVYARVAERGVAVWFAPRSGLRHAVPWLRALVHMEQPDIVHTTLFNADVAGRLAAIGGPHVLTSLVSTPYYPGRHKHDPNLSRYKLEVVRRIDALTARHCTTHFHALTRAVADAAVRDLGIPADRITIVERGRDPTRFRPASPRGRARAREELGLPSDADVVVSVARQDFPKGQTHLLRAFAQVLAHRPRARLVIAGREGHATAQLREMAAADGMRGAVKFLGHVSDVRSVLAASDVFVFPSLHEGQGGAVVEAMACGLPIVLSDVPALREVVEHEGNAVLVPPADAAALAEGVLHLLQDPTAAQLRGERCRDVFERRFTLERSTRRMADLYLSLARPLAGMRLRAGKF